MVITYNLRLADKVSNVQEHNHQALGKHKPLCPSEMQLFHLHFQQPEIIILNEPKQLPILKTISIIKPPNLKYIKKITK